VYVTLQLFRTALTGNRCVLYGSQNERGLLPFTILSDWFLYGITETHCLLHVWTESFNILQATFSIQGRALALTVRHPLLTTDACVRALAGPCAICGGQSDDGTGFPPSTCVFPCQFQYYYTNIPYTYSSLPTTCPYRKDRRTNPVEPCKNQCYFGNR
jgi:hypothetical protein